MDRTEAARKVRERYHWLKEHGICVQCGQADAEQGLTKCPACREKHREQVKKWADANAEYMRQERRQWREAHRTTIANICASTCRTIRGQAGLWYTKSPKSESPTAPAAGRAAGNRRCRFPAGAGRILTK